MLQVIKRYFVDDRVGCVAVRDRRLTDPDYPGLHPDTDGVVKFWSRKTEAKHCVTCGHSTGFNYVDGGELQEATQLADTLNINELIQIL